MSEHPFLQVLAAAGLYNPEAGPPRADLSGFPSAAAGDASARRYAEAALRDECTIVAAAAEGSRNDVLNTAAFKLGSLVAAGHLGGQEVIDGLHQAARIAGLPSLEIDRTVQRAVGDGARTPRDVKLEPREEIRPAFTLLPGGADPDTPAQVAVEPPDPFAKLRTGGSFLLDLPPKMDPLWGDGDHVLWAPGESLMVVGPPGVGKTTVVQQMVIARLGLVDRFLGYPVRVTESKVLYLAMDRPRQIARSMRRMVDEGDRALLDERLIVWEGPLPYDVSAMPSVLVKLAEHTGADTVVVDSLKDAANGLVDSEKAGTYNRARQMALSAGIEVVEIAHQRKGSGDRAPKTLQDVHGGMEITAGAGSVFLVWGEAGDPVVEFRHLKQPAELVGPLQLVHDHPAGRTTVEERATPYDLLKSTPGKWWTAKEVATACGDEVKPSKAAVERFRRKLEQLVSTRVAKRMERPIEGSGLSAFQSAYTYDGPDAWATDFEG